MAKKSKKIIDSSWQEIVSLTNRKVLITGAGAGIGLATAKRVAEAGGELLLLDINADSLKKLEKLLFANKCKTFVVDLANKLAIDHFWQSLNDDDLPDVLINNAGIFPEKSFLDIDPDFLQKNMDVNFGSIFWMCQSFIRRRIKKGGVIVNISSVEAVVAFKDKMAHYSTSKAGVLALTRCLARDYGKQGFRVNAIMPGGVNTEGAKEILTKALREADFGLLKTGYNFQQRVALGRIAYPDEIARAVLFLATNQSSYVQGICLPVDGGFLAT